jgi:hypothetical protein
MDGPVPLIPRSPSPTPRVSPHTPPARSKPDAKPMRIALGAGGIAAFSALAAAIVLPPRPAVLPTTPYLQQPVTNLPGTVVATQAPILYLQLQPGQTAPPGAKVISSSPAAAAPAAAAPVAAPAAARVAAPVAPKPIIVKTTQSGTVIP